MFKLHIGRNHEMLYLTAQTVCAIHLHVLKNGGSLYPAMSEQACIISIHKGSSRSLTPSHQPHVQLVSLTRKFVLKITILHGDPFIRKQLETNATSPEKQSLGRSVHIPRNELIVRYGGFYLKRCTYCICMKGLKLSPAWYCVNKSRTRREIDSWKF